MSSIDKPARIRRLAAALPHLSDALIAWIERVVTEMAKPCSYIRNAQSDIVDDRFLADFGDTLRLHHCFSDEPFSKDKFEYAMQWVARSCGRQADLAPKGNRGHDITIDNVAYSLKTQAAKGTMLNELHISKFMELGKGAWGTDVRELNGLRTQFLNHMKNYSRIVVLRYLSHTGPTHHYELVEIPKSLLESASGGELSMMDKSKQMPRPGYCKVRDEDGLVFELYFDGGTERKLQIRHLRKSYCTVHADWSFDR